MLWLCVTFSWSGKLVRIRTDPENKLQSAMPFFKTMGSEPASGVYGSIKNLSSSSSLPTWSPEPGTRYHCSRRLPACSPWAVRTPGRRDSPPGDVVSEHTPRLNKGIIDTQRNGSRDSPPGGVVSAHAPRVNKRNNWHTEDWPREFSTRWPGLCKPCSSYLV